jgi:hypothetical protein
MSRKSRHEELRKLAFGSDALYGGITASKDMMGVVLSGAPSRLLGGITGADYRTAWGWKEW